MKRNIKLEKEMLERVKPIVESIYWGDIYGLSLNDEEGGVKCFKNDRTDGTDILQIKCVTDIETMVENGCGEIVINIIGDMIYMITNLFFESEIIKNDPMELCVQLQEMVVNLIKKHDEYFEKQSA